MAAEISPEKLAELKSLGGDELIAKLLAKFIENSEKLLRDALAAVAANDAAKAEYCVHTLKGSALSLGLTDMSNILVDLNTRTKAKNLTNADQDLKALQKMLQDVSKYKAEKFP
ncbi:MAG: Hpt domain-containing protein [Leptospiraceae bacterium]|nr:Hpt domain-containing protein [Leptospiraceae bacterium]